MIKKIINTIITCALAVCPSYLSAQEPVTLKILDWNVLSFEGYNNPNNDFNIAPYIQTIKENDPDVVCFNEFETASDRMNKEKLAEVAVELKMYAYFIESYPKSGGYYGNCILSKYPIINTRSQLHAYQHAKGPGNYDHNSGDCYSKYGADQRSMGYADIAVPNPSGTDYRIVRIATSHFEAFAPAADQDRIRTEQCEAACAFLHLTAPEYPTVFSGDFNTGDTFTTLRSLEDNGSLVHSHYLDYIYVFPKNSWTVVSRKTVDAGMLSDHDAVFAEIRLN